MVIYCLMIISSYSLIAISRKFSEKFKNILILIALLMPAFVAGARDIGVGTDTLVYGEKYFKIVCEQGIQVLLLYTDCEIGYGLFIYIISLFTHNIFWQFFWIEFVIVLLIWMSIYNYLEEKYRALAMLIYYLLFFPFSLNIMRQSIAMAIILFSMKFIKQRNFYKFVLSIIAAASFQKTSVVAVGIYLVYWILDDKKHTQKKCIKDIFQKIKKYARWPIILFAIGLTVFIVTKSRDIITFLHFYFDDFYAIYNGMQTGGSSLRMTFYFVAMLLTALLIIPKRNIDYKFFICVMVLGIIFIQLKNVSTEAYRIALYYLYFAIIGFPKYFAVIRKHRTSCFVQKLVLVVLMIAYYIDFFILQGYNHIFPYTSSMFNL